MIIFKSDEEVEIIRKNCLLVNETIAEIAKQLKPGVTTQYLNDLADDYIRDHGAIPSFKNYHGFPYASCMSVNDAVVHGFPTSEELNDGDIVSIDIGVYRHQFHGDSAYTFGIGEITENIQQLMRVTKDSLYRGIEKAIAGNRIGDISNAIQEYTERKYGYGVVRELVGHGVGKDLHEDPQVPNYGKRGSGAKLAEGIVIAIEPMINMGKKDVFNDKDGWTIRTKDRKPSAHYEHTVCIKKNKANILSSFEKIELVEKENPALWSGY
ncbi:type I methionyl aminopeptidase [soil metagenome]